LKRILLMDDSPIFLEVTRAALEAVGYQVACASDLAELARVRDHAPTDLALVLMDVQMPEVFGDDVALTLRHAYGFSVPIYCTSRPMASRRARTSSCSRRRCRASKRSSHAFAPTIGTCASR
jgi:CheY-like chemotaxis protein